MPERKLCIECGKEKISPDELDAQKAKIEREKQEAK
jgi:hypothetical protein